ncbi:hypothetical protein KVT40_001288 [Elsinoe batatas]|uniref:DUF1308 domain-containing protein n=1 Tax=Elsinoe batatas TaxID=2601811 RepID=A0A8K0LCK3_9PEZI|nr:hypothetical protein KVT40_001288 [Elsinoe batatas]
MSLPIRSNGSAHNDQDGQAASSHETSSNDASDFSFLQGSGSPQVLLARCQILWHEIESFRAALRERLREHTVELSNYRGIVKSELKNLERLVQKQEERDVQKKGEAKLGNDANGHSREPGEGDGQGDGEDDEDSASMQKIVSSNLPFLATIWHCAKSTSGLVAMQKRFYFGEYVERNSPARGGRRGRGRRRGPGNHMVKPGKALVDVVSKEGLEWIKVSLVTNHRMIMDKAREGWAGDSSEEDDSDSDGSAKSADDPDASIPVVKMGEAMLAAAKEVRIRTKHPRVRMVLPRIVEGQQPEIDKIVKRLRVKGISVECGETAVMPQTLDSVVNNMITNPFADFTPSLNIDCTILLGLVSDFSHSDVESEPWFHRALKRQVEIEDKESLLTNQLYPAIVGHRLVCSAEAAKRMKEIVDTIGTPDEKARTALFMGDDVNRKYSEEETRSKQAELAKLSKFDVPDGLHIPVLVVDKGNIDFSKLPPVATKVKETLTSINQSVFLFGWSNGHTTITSNRTVVKGIEQTLDQHAESETDWPSIWLCPTARSLVGKEKGRRE